jgi:glycosyltransferase involved in cell wall biosynthesis
MFNILFTIWLENINSAIIKNQVFDLLVEKQKVSKFNTKIYILSFQPFYNYFYYKSKLKDTIAELNNYGIVLIILPCIKIPYLNISGKWFIPPFVLLQSFPYLFYFIIVKKIDLIHSRSYNITLGNIVLSKLFKLKILFDPRSNYPEENITFFNPNTYSYKIWKKLEKFYMNNSNFTIVTSYAHMNHLMINCNKSIFILIHNNVDTRIFNPILFNKELIKKELKISNNTLVFCYNGSFNFLWNHPDIYSKFILSLRKNKLKFIMLFLTNNTNIIKQSLNKYNIFEHEYFIMRPNINEIPKYLSIADYGLNLMFKKDSRLSIKTVEYLSMNIPVITNSNVLGAAEIVSKYNVGLVIDNIDNITEIDLSNIIINNNICREIACEKFSTNKLALVLNKLYESFI